MRNGEEEGQVMGQGVEGREVSVPSKSESRD